MERRRRGHLISLAQLALVAWAEGAKPGQGDRLVVGGGRDFPWLNLAATFAPSYEAYNSTDGVHDRVEALVASCSRYLSHDSKFARQDKTFPRVLRLRSPDPPKNATRVVLNFGIHGREYISAEVPPSPRATTTTPRHLRALPPTSRLRPQVALAFLYRMCDGSSRSLAVLATTDFIVLPLLNIAGRRRVESSDESIKCSDMRKNSRHVDVNRNFDFHFAEGSDNAGDEDYRGRAPNSELETQLLIDVADSFKPDVFIDVHSGARSRRPSPASSPPHTHTHLHSPHAHTLTAPPARQATRQ